MLTSEILDRAVNCKTKLAALTTEQKNEAIMAMAKSVMDNIDSILEENKKDVENARGTISEVMLDRLSLNADRITGMANGMLDVMKLPDPNHKVLRTVERPNGLVIKKTSMPMGVIGIIYESRPNVTSDAAVLCFKSSNVCVLRGGKEAYKTSKKIVEALRDGLEVAGIDKDCIQLIDDTTHDSATEMMIAKGKIDLLIPRGGRNLIKACVKNATVPCIETGTGICHIYVEKSANQEMALDIIDNAKTSRPSVCNAMEVCLVDSDIAAEFLPKLHKRLTVDRENPVSFVVDEKASVYIKGEPAGEDSFDTEYLDYKMSVAVVEDVNQAIEHISKHSTGHSEAIITTSDDVAVNFVNSIDSAAVYVNASTRFTDGGEFGLGCEMGISTQKMHARGPMGLEELMTYHYVIEGSGQIR